MRERDPRAAVRRAVRRPGGARARSATSNWCRDRSWTGSSTACTGRRTTARRWISPSTAATPRVTTSAASTGGCTRAPIASTSRSTRPTSTPTSPSCSTCRSRWATAAAASPSSNTRRMFAGCLTYLVHRQRDRVGFVAFDDDIVELVPPSAKHMDMMLHVLDRLKPSKPGSCRGRCTRWPSTTRRGRAGDRCRISTRSRKRCSKRSRRCASAVTTWSCSTCSTRRKWTSTPGCVGVRGSRERGADAGRAGRARRPVSRADPGAHEALSRNSRELRVDYTLVNDLDAARSRAVHLSLGS